MLGRYSRRETSLKRPQMLYLMTRAWQALLWLLILAALTLLLRLGIYTWQILAPRAAEQAQPSAAAAETSKFLLNNQARYRAATARAKRWVDSLELDPLQLRQHNIKGKKKLAECIDFYVRLHSVAPATEKAALLKSIAQRAACTYRPAYHDMASLDQRHFKEDATSYLRVAWLLDQVGLDTSLYREEIAKILPLLNAHMSSRGIDQRMAFNIYYQHFGLNEPFPLTKAYAGGVIANRFALAEFNNEMIVYRLTHEIFVPYQFGSQLDAVFFSAADKAYLSPLLAALAERYINVGNLDLIAELSSCMSYLGFNDLPVYQKTLEYLLDNQRPEGKWGYYEHYRPGYGNYVNQGFYLHTTLVALDALIAAFRNMPVDSP